MILEELITQRSIQVLERVGCGHLGEMSVRTADADSLVVIDTTRATKPGYEPRTMLVCDGRASVVIRSFECPLDSVVKENVVVNDAMVRDTRLVSQLRKKLEKLAAENGGLYVDLGGGTK